MGRSVSVSSAAVREGVVEHALRVRRPRGDVPVLLWRPGGPGPPPRLVLLGHGGSHHKRSDRILELAIWLVETAGLAAAAIDGPFHGERANGEFTVSKYQACVATEGAANVVERMVGDWRATIEAVAARGLAATDVLGYLGVSMGARYGLPLAAALGERVRCAVLGSFGLTQTSLLPQALDTADVAREAAGRLGARTLFHVQWDDEVFPRAGQLALFDLLATDDKRLIAYPGTHGDVPAEAVAAWQAFLADSLASD